MENTSRLNLAYVWSICLVAACGGLLFGYDWVVIGGAKPFYEAYFGITNPAQSGWAMSSALAGCVLGAIISGTLSDRFGRKLPLLLAALMFTASAWGAATAHNFSIFVAFRIIGGIGIGLASALSPMYIAEVSPAGKRGTFVAVNQLTIVIGVLAAQLVNLMIAEPVAAHASAAAIAASWNGQMGWRFCYCCLWCRNPRVGWSKSAASKRLKKCCPASATPVMRVPCWPRSGSPWMRMMPAGSGCRNCSLRGCGR
jgi:MFS family permease